MATKKVQKSTWRGGGEIPPLLTSDTHSATLSASEQERRDFIDRVAIAVYAANWPEARVYERASRLWDRRAEWLRTEEFRLNVNKGK